jgi:hypothetical protein
MLRIWAQSVWRRAGSAGLALLLLGVLLAAAWPSDHDCHESETHHDACPALQCCGPSHAPLLSTTPGALVQRTETVDDVVRLESLATDLLIVSPPFQPPRA